MKNFVALESRYTRWLVGVACAAALAAASTVALAHDHHHDRSDDDHDRSDNDHHGASAGITRLAQHLGPVELAAVRRHADQRRHAHRRARFGHRRGHARRGERGMDGHRRVERLHHR